MKSWYNRTILPRLLTSGMNSERFNAIRKDVLKDAQGTVLEIGIGPGYNIPLYQGIEKLYALEPSSELIDVAKIRAKDATFPVEFLQDGAEQIPLAENSVDTVVSTWTLCSVGDPQKVLREIHRVLKPQGRFVFVDHGAAPQKVVHGLQSAFTSVAKHFTGNCHTDRYIEELIRGAGFAIQNMEHPSQAPRILMYLYKGIATKSSVI